MNLQRTNKFLSKAIGGLAEALNRMPGMLSEGRGETLVQFFVQKKKGFRAPRYVVYEFVVPMPIALGNDKLGNYRRIIDSAWVEFQKRKGGKFKIVQSSIPHRTLLSNGKPVGIQVQVKLPKGWML